MSDPVTRKTHNYDPNNFKVPEFRKDEEGRYAPTEYQAAVGLKDFMQRNNALFLNKDQLSEANNKGTVTFGDRVVQLNDQEKAMFEMVSDGLFNRLDAGDNGTHDGVVGGKDIDTAIKEKSWVLHGSKTSPDGHWKDPTASVSITTQQAKERLVKFMEEGNGTTTNDGKPAFNHHVVSYAIVHQRIGTQFNDNVNYIDDPAVVEAFLLLREDYRKINTDRDSFITLDEIKNWKV